MSCKYFSRIPTKTTFILAESWKSYQLIRGRVVCLFTIDTCDVVRSWSIILLPSIVLENLFEFFKHCECVGGGGEVCLFGLFRDKV